jgi:tetratricopeptide (TPR) repeat protein
MKSILYAAAAVALVFPGIAGAANYCGPLRGNHYGPYDYRTDKEKLPVVDNAHFTAEVEQGKSGSSSYLGDDLNYTLTAFPNHHRALVALTRIALRDKTVQIPHSKYPVECYFVRAQQFAPDDGVARAVYGTYLYGLGRYDKALEIYKEAIALAPDDPTINYNIGLAYLKKNDYEHALQHAHKAYDMGYPLKGLKNQLVKAGKWTEPTDNAGKPE